MNSQPTSAELVALASKQWNRPAGGPDASRYWERTPAFQELLNRCGEDESLMHRWRQVVARLKATFGDSAQDITYSISAIGCFRCLIDLPAGATGETLQVVGFLSVVAPVYGVVSVRQNRAAVGDWLNQFEEERRKYPPGRLLGGEGLAFEAPDALPPPDSNLVRLALNPPQDLVRFESDPETETGFTAIATAIEAFFHYTRLDAATMQTPVPGLDLDGGGHPTTLAQCLFANPLSP